MTGLSDIINVFGEQSALSGVQDWAQQQAQNGNLPPQLADLAQKDPRSFRAMLPDILQRQMQMAGAQQLAGGSAPQSALAQYGSTGDQAPNSPVPQGLPSGQAAQRQFGVSDLPAATQATGSVDNGIKLIQALKGLSVPPGMGPIPAGQQYVNGTLQNIPGAMTPGQQDRDKDFADIYTPFKNTGGQQNAASQLNAIQGVIDQLKGGQVTTGPGTLAPTAFNEEGDPNWAGRLADPSLAAAHLQVMKALLPSAKALFGARVTQKEVAMNVMANGLNPYAPVEENIENLTTLKNNLANAQTATAAAGQYFDKNGTLAGYQGPVPGIDPPATPLNPSGATNQPNPQLIETLKKRGLIKNGG